MSSTSNLLPPCLRCLHRAAGDKSKSSLFSPAQADDALDCGKKWGGAVRGPCHRASKGPDYCIEVPVPKWNEALALIEELRDKVATSDSYAGGDLRERLYQFLPMLFIRRERRARIWTIKSISTIVAN